MKTSPLSAVFGTVSVAVFCVHSVSAAPLARSTPADARLAAYFEAETATLANRCLAEVRTRQDWEASVSELRRQHAEMLGLDPMPARTDLKPVITGRIERDDFAVEKLYFQSMPNLYVTANLYLPKNLTKPAPAILYVCGHGPVVSNSVSYGNKVSYQHHGIWFARHGYVCLVIDTLQLGEIQGIHHGTYRYGQWWWNSRGYTPAGVEAWNGIRALDYLSSRPEVDTNRFGVTGRSGGGAYSWTITSLDERVKVAAPVAGITDLENHVVHGAVEGHCDCMFIVNTYRWDYPMQAALAAPRPLLLVNTDSDTIFPLDGVLRTHAHLRRLYRLYNASNQLGLVIGPGPHKDTQNLQVPVLRWFNQHLKGEDPLIEDAAVKLFAPEQLKVFANLPADAINTNIQASFVRPAPPAKLPATSTEWQAMREGWLRELRAKSFRGWPDNPGPLNLGKVGQQETGGVRIEAWEFTGQTNVQLRLYLARPSGLSKAERVVLRVGESQPIRDDAPFADEVNTAFACWPDALTQLRSNAPGSGVFAVLLPRGVGRDVWTGDARKQTQIRRRFLLLGQTLDGMRVWDIRRGIQALKTMDELRRLPVELDAEGPMAVNALFASLFEDGLRQIDLREIPTSLMDGPDYLKVLKVLDLPQAVALAAERCPTRLRLRDASGWEFPASVARELRWAPNRFVLDVPPARHRSGL
jgi:dienelactone hydrolase